LRAYLAFAFSQSNRMDFLQAMDENPPAAVLNEIGKRTHNVWETAVWMEIAGRRLVRRADGHFRIIPAGEVKPGDTVLPNDLRPVRVKVRDDGQFTWEPTQGATNFWMYDRGDPRRNEAALREAMPALYGSFRP
jgi:8-oxo-dGTP pyrophosphatase MutT (NUDIX family)